MKLSTIEKDCRWENTRSTCEVNGVTVENSGRYTYLAHMSLLHVLVLATTIKHLSIKKLRMNVYSLYTISISTWFTTNSISQLMYAQRWFPIQRCLEQRKVVLQLLALGPRWTLWKMRGENVAFVG